MFIVIGESARNLGMHINQKCRFPWPCWDHGAFLSHRASLSHHPCDFWIFLDVPMEKPAVLGIPKPF